MTRTGNFRATPSVSLRESPSRDPPFASSLHQDGGLPFQQPCRERGNAQTPKLLKHVAKPWGRAHTCRHQEAYPGLPPRHPCSHAMTCPTSSRFHPPTCNLDHFGQHDPLGAQARHVTSRPGELLILARSSGTPPPETRAVGTWLLAAATLHHCVGSCWENATRAKPHRC